MGAELLFVGFELGCAKLLLVRCFARREAFVGLPVWRFETRALGGLDKEGNWLNELSCLMRAVRSKGSPMFGLVLGTMLVSALTEGWVTQTPAIRPAAANSTGENLGRTISGAGDMMLGCANLLASTLQGRSKRFGNVCALGRSPLLLHNNFGLKRACSSERLKYGNHAVRLHSCLIETANQGTQTRAINYDKLTSAFIRAHVCYACDRGLA